MPASVSHSVEEESVSKHYQTGSVAVNTKDPGPALLELTASLGWGGRETEMTTALPVVRELDSDGSVSAASSWGNLVTWQPDLKCVVDFYMA